MSYQYQNGPGYPPPYPQPPRKNNTPLIVGLAVFAVGAVVALVLVLVLRGGDNNTSNESGNSLPGGGGGGDTSSSQALAQTVAGLIQNHSTAELEKLVCKPDARFSQRMKSLEGTEMTVTVKEVKETGPTTADAVFTLVRSSDNKSGNQSMHMSQVDGKWCIGG
jgi:hypothetical protein